ncbi:hypothetical protein N5915_08135 [Arcobacter lacus]|jgi:YHS domain-containing protein|uniref:DUF2116 family Zn-ribbon domain-containing protein n=1 Tax=Arcobacter lacus TaxID=1912876 RepID=A0ABX5JI88_9BACT|nr:hypothetical protein [Arcobacter lacus]MCT7909522.1 hypothetical protein [Arcobacter lacus]MCT7911921.1 hypothetical protein [Arcobacter lacus]PUE67079.1 hypothetical protein B0175_04255 [Arcobacter lacus]
MTNSCQYCSKKIPISKVFCSAECKESYFQKIAISVPKPFVKKLYFFCSEEQKESEIKTFAQRHNWNEKLVTEKIKEVFEEYYQCG